MPDLTTNLAPQFPTARSCPFAEPSGYDELRQQGKIARATLYNGREVWVVTDYDEGRRVLSDHGTFSSYRPDPRFPATAPRFESARKVRNFLGMDQPEHTKQRRMVTATFTNLRIERIRPRAQAIADELIDGIVAAGAPADLVPAYALSLPSRVICELLGVPYADHDFFEHHSSLIVHGDTSLEDSAAAFRTVAEYLAELIRRKRDEPGDGLLDALIQNFLVPGEISETDLSQMALLLLVAGHETTANAIALGVLTLLERPEARAAATPALVDELLRWLSVADGVPRFALRDTEIAGQPVREGDGVIIGIAAMNRDPDVFVEPDELVPERSGRRHLAFGFGIHQCLGQNLARMELEVSLSRILARLPGLALATPADDLPLRHPSGLHGLGALPVTW